MRRPVDTVFGTVPPGMCERCYEMGVLTPAKIVHHKIHLTPMNIDDPHVSLNYGNLQRLCQDCHAEVHAGTTQSRVTFDENGRPMPIKRKGYDFTCMHVPDRNRYDSKERHEQDVPQLQAL